MFCTNCGKKLYDGDRFCGNCGRKVRSDAPAPKPVRRFTLALSAVIHIRQTKLLHSVTQKKLSLQRMLHVQKQDLQKV